MALFKDKVELSMSDSKKHVVEKYVFDVKKGTIEIKVASGYEAIINGTEKIGPNQTRTYSRKAMGDTITAFVYVKSTNLRPLSVPFVAGQHTISLDAKPTAKVRFALVGTAQVEIADYKDLCRYFDNTLSYEDIDKALLETFRPALTAQMTAAAKSHINTASTDVSIFSDIRAIATAGLANSTLKMTLMNMGLIMSASGVSLWLNPLGDTNEIIDKINAKFTEAAVDEFDEAKADKKRAWEREDKLIDNQHEIDVITAEHTHTHNEHTTSDHSYSGTGPKEVHVHEGRGKRKATRFCSTCGSRLKEDADFCPNCGNKIDD